MWRSKSELATVKSDLEESAMHVSILQDKLALYKTQLSAEQLANLRETQGVADAIKKIQQTGTVQQRIDLGRSVLVGYNSAGFNHATEVKSDPDRVDTVRLAPAAKGAKP